MEKAKTIIAAGHICLDITPIFTGEKVDKLNEILAPGKLINMEGISIHTGGSTANTGLGLKFLGANVRIMAKVGCDLLGKMVGQILKSHGVTEGLIYDEKSSTSYSIVLAIPGVDRIFLHDSGANDRYFASDIQNADYDSVDLFHFGYPPLMKSIYQNNGEELLKVIKLIKEKRIPISMDMASVDPKSEAGSVDWMKILERTLPYVDVFLPSIEEIMFMLDKEKYNDIIVRAGERDITEILDIENDVKPLGEKLLAMGTKIVLLKCGRAGIYLATASEEKLEELSSEIGLNKSVWSSVRIFERCFKPDKICSGTGAGDTCIAAFLMALLTGETPQSSIQLAAAEGASCVEAYDALGGLRTLSELKDKISSGWEKY